MSHSLQPRFIGLQYFCSIALAVFMFAGLLAAPAAGKSPKQELAEAIRDFKSVSLPMLEKMSPFIEKSAPERIAAYQSLKLTDTICVNGTGSGFRADQVAAEAAARVCVETAAWLAGNDVLVCRYGSWDTLTQATGSRRKPDNQIQKMYEKRGVDAIHERVMLAAGCAQKDKPYWAGRVVDIFTSAAGSSKIGADGKIVATAANGEWPFRSCSYAGLLAGQSDISFVAGAALQGCDSISSFMYSVVPDRQSTCNALKIALGVVAQNPGKDILEKERANVQALLETNYTGLNCASAISAPAVIAGAAPTKTVEQRALELVNEITGEIAMKDSNLKFAETWEDRGEYAKACSYYSQGLRGLARIYSLYLELTHVTGDPAYTTKAKTFEKEELEVRAYARQECKARGISIF